MDVIIVSKTHMSNAACVGGILLSGRFVRLLDLNGHNQDINTDINIGDVYTITYAERQCLRPPHVEDILVKTMTFKSSLETTEELVAYIKQKLKSKIWEGSTEILFDGKLQWTNSGSGYISVSGGIPESSVGFWIPNRDLTRHDYQENIRYSFPIKWRNIKFVGFQEPIERIPAGTLTRVSLARWWSPSEEEERCYLQLSGWYDS